MTTEYSSTDKRVLDGLVVVGVQTGRHMFRTMARGPRLLDPRRRRPKVLGRTPFLLYFTTKDPATQECRLPHVFRNRLRTVTEGSEFNSRSVLDFHFFFYLMFMKFCDCNVLRSSAEKNNILNFRLLLFLRIILGLF